MVDVDELCQYFDIGNNYEEPLATRQSYSDVSKIYHVSYPNDARSGAADAQEKLDGLAGQQLRKLLDIEDSRAKGT